MPGFLVAALIVLPLVIACEARPSLTSNPVESSATPWEWPTPTPDPWLALARPLGLPSVGPGDSCPATTSTLTLQGIGPLLGDGPIYPAVRTHDGVLGLRFDDPTRTAWIDGRRWFGIKTLWVSNDPARGIGLVRAERLDDEGGIWFHPRADPEYVRELRLTAEPWVSGPQTPAGWREYNSIVYLAEPGCYGFQIDGETFSTVVVLRVDATS